MESLTNNIMMFVRKKIKTSALNESIESWTKELLRGLSNYDETKCWRHSRAKLVFRIGNTQEAFQLDSCHSRIGELAIFD